MIVTLPWPPKELSPNARVHWAKKAKAAKGYGIDAHFASFARGNSPPPAGSAPLVSITFYPPDNRRRDLDNMLASIKSGLDGIASAIGIDDSKWSLTIRKGEPVKGGRVIVEVTA
jgi:crossover junction endodeoxyribonuclease RusA